MANAHSADGRSLGSGPFYRKSGKNILPFFSRILGSYLAWIDADGILLCRERLGCRVCDACGIELQLENISRVQTRLGSKTETASFVMEDY
eukprot:COSAG02_NODE_4567_length_5211_cov_1170.642606_1_plen_91_part_00